MAHVFGGGITVIGSRGLRRGHEHVRAFTIEGITATRVIRSPHAIYGAIISEGSSVVVLRFGQKISKLSTPVTTVPDRSHGASVGTLVPDRIGNMRVDAIPAHTIGSVVNVVSGGNWGSPLTQRLAHDGRPRPCREVLRVIPTNIFRIFLRRGDLLSRVSRIGGETQPYHGVNRIGVVVSDSVDMPFSITIPRDTPMRDAVIVSVHRRGDRTSRGRDGVREVRVAISERAISVPDISKAVLAYSSFVSVTNGLIFLSSAR